MEKILLKNVGKKNSQEIDVYISGGGYESLKKALKMDSQKIIEEIKKSKLVGRGGAAFPTGLKWELVRKEKETPKYIVCNADEGEPGTFKDRIILKNDPHFLIESMIIAGWTIGANKGYIYIRGEYYEEIGILEKAIRQAREKNFLGNKILGSDFSFDILIYQGAGAYVCGEEFALLESMEGKRGQTREKPPFPTQIGFKDKPTLVNNVETLCCIPVILEKGGQWYAQIGSPDSPGTKLFSLSGDVNQPGVYELPLGISLKELIENYGKGVDGEFKAALIAGVSAPLLTDINVKLDYASVRVAGSALGSASIIVINHKRNIVEISKNIVEFFAHESCGLCSPCREGTRRAKEILERFSVGKGKKEEIDLLNELGEVMADACACGLGRSALAATISGIKNFHQEFTKKVQEENNDKYLYR